MNKQISKKFYRKVKFGVNIPLKVFKKPIYPESVTSDLFPIRNDENWSTEFEFLNIPGLIQGDISNTHKGMIIFFDEDGIQLGCKKIEMQGEGRKTLILTEMLVGELRNSATFAVFHESDRTSINLNGSFLAERGYVGYKHKNSSVKGYVHGNLDAISIANNKIQRLGNYGFFTKIYRVQHLLTGSARYEFIFTNPTNKKTIKITPTLIDNKGRRKLQTIQLKPQGSKIISVNVKENQSSQIIFASKLYLGRPIVFRKIFESFDVFHG